MTKHSSDNPNIILIFTACFLNQDHTTQQDIQTREECSAFHSTIAQLLILPMTIIVELRGCMQLWTECDLT